jgi:hypothetical protein
MKNDHLRYQRILFWRKLDMVIRQSASCVVSSQDELG